MKINPTLSNGSSLSNHKPGVALAARSSNKSKLAQLTRQLDNDADLTGVFYWKQAQAYLQDFKEELGHSYRYALTVVAIAMGCRELSSCEHRIPFVLTDWEAGAICGVSSDRIYNLRKEHQEVLEKLFYHKRFHQTVFNHVLCAGLFYKVKLNPNPQKRLTDRVKGDRDSFRHPFRNLKHDIECGHTARGWKGQGHTSNSRGRVKHRMLQDEVPEGEALDMLSYTIHRARGLLKPEAQGESLRDQVRTSTEDIHSLLHQVEHETLPDQDQQQYVYRLARTFVQLFGDPRSQNFWVGLSWKVVQLKKHGQVRMLRLLSHQLHRVLLQNRDCTSLNRPSALFVHFLKTSGWWKEYETLKTAA